MLTPREAVDAIINDLSDRRGIGDEWDQIEKEVQHEIRDKWVEIVERVGIR